MNTASSVSTGPQPRHREQFRRILQRNVTLPLAVGLVSAVLFTAIAAYLLAVLERVADTDRVIVVASHAARLKVDMETGMRGYLLTGEQEFLQPYTRARAQMPDELARLRELLADRPEQQTRVDRLVQLQQEWMGYAEEIIALRELGEDAVALVQSGRGNELTRSSRQLFEELIGVERQQRLERNARARTTAVALIGSFLMFGLAMSVLLSWRGRRELVTLSENYERALATQRDHAVELEQQAWQRGGQTELASRLTGRLPLPAIGEQALSFLTDYLGAPAGALYYRQPDGSLQLAAACGIDPAQRRAALGAEEGLPARVLQTGRSLQLDDLPGDSLPLVSGLVRGQTCSVLLVPTLHDGNINGVLELGFLRRISAAERRLLETVARTIGASIEAARYRERLQEVLAETQQLNEELQTQQEELRAANEELAAQSRVLQESQKQMERQQAELEQANEHLAERGEELLTQRDELNRRNAALQRAQQELEERAHELAQASRYKSEFLANMSHELRTPLNSSLILARLLADNGAGNLSAEQVRFAESIYAAGNELLTLINDILDISKVEAGKLDINIAAFPLQRVLDDVVALFRPQAEQAGLEFRVELTEPLPASLVTDRLRLEQILKNLVGNAIKFTETGSVTLVLAAAGDALSFQVRDTGIGIAPEHHQLVFEAFQQADGTISRRFGGTGLGLPISRQLAQLLGGDITVESAPGVGSTFTLTVPVALSREAERPAGGADARPAATPKPLAAAVAAATSAPSNMPLQASSQVAPASVPGSEGTPAAGQPGWQDDRDQLPWTGRTVLVIEDEPTFATILYDLAHELGYRCLLTFSADEGVALAERYQPDAILLDMKLPDQSGLTVLERLKRESRTRHIPVHIISVEDRWQPAMHLGAIGYAFKPTSRDQLKEIFAQLEARLDQTVKRVLVVEDEARQREAISRLIGDDDVEITAVGTGSAALEQLSQTVFDCMIIDLQLPDMSGHALLRQMTSTEICSFPPVVVYTGRSLSADEEAELMRYSRSIIIKGARSPERLLDEVTLFLHKVESDLPQEHRNMLRVARSRDRQIEGRRILLVDDDVRNLFALTSALESKGAEVVVARNGVEALEQLAAADAVDLVLMDIMMPEMDGYQAMEQIRSNPAWRLLPIIAVTAKAMKDDQERCLQAGANDYMAKPIDLDRLFSLIRVWLPSLERA